MKLNKIKILDHWIWNEQNKYQFQTLKNNNKFIHNLGMSLNKIEKEKMWIIEIDFEKWPLDVPNYEIQRNNVN